MMDYEMTTGQGTRVSVRRCGDIVTLVVIDDGEELFSLGLAVDGMRHLAKAIIEVTDGDSHP